MGNLNRRACFRHLEEYADTHTERSRNLRQAICKRMNLTSLAYQSLEDIFESIGLDPDKVCTYCRNGKG